MKCRECDRLAATVDRRQELYLDALGRARSVAENVNPNHYFRLKKAVEDARFGLDMVMEELLRHRDEHTVVKTSSAYSQSTLNPF